MAHGGLPLSPPPPSISLSLSFPNIPSPQVNRSPSFHTDAPLDKEVKEGLLHDTLELLDLHANSKRRCLEEEKKKVRERLLCRQKLKENRYD